MFQVVLTLAAAFWLFPQLLRFLRDQWRMAQVAKTIPGLPELPFIGSAHIFVGLKPKERMTYLFGEVDRILGEGENVLKLWIATRLYVCPLDGAAAKPLLDSSEEISKGSDYKFLEAWLGTGLLTSGGDKWRLRRRLLTPSFHFAMLDGYMAIFDECTRTMMDVLDKKVGEPFEIFPHIKHCTLDIICKTAMGVSIDIQRCGSHPYSAAIEEMGKMMLSYSIDPRCWFPPYWHLSGRSARYRKALSTLNQFTLKVIADRKKLRASGESDEGELARPCLLDQLLDMGEKGDLDDEGIREEVDTFVAGHDTSSVGIGWMLWCMACHPEIQERARKEVQDIFGEDVDAACTSSAVKEMHFVERCIRESLRLFPPAPLTLRRLQNDLNMGGHVVPAGATIVIPYLILHNNKKVYENPHVFDPDRFLPERSGNRSPYDYIPFSAGPRNCIGQKFAMREQKVIMSWFLRRFRISATIPFEENKHRIDIILRPSKGFVLSLERL